MESVIAWALADKLGYWIKSFSREKLRLRGRTAQLSNAEIDGDALHAALGLPPALAIATARIQELVITLPSILNMQVEPTVVNIDRLDIILEEKDEMENHSSPNSNVTSPSSTKDSGHGYADKKVEWKSLTVDLKPHVNNSADVQLNSSIGQYSAQDDGGAIQMPYVGERVFEGKSGEANITIQRTEQNDLLGLEFQVHIIEALSPALSEHGLLTLVSFITSLCVVLSRRAADPGQKARVEGLQAIRPHLRNPATGNGTAQRHQAGRTLVSSDQGTDIEATMVTSQDGSGVSKWTVDKTRFSVEDLVTGAVLTKEEQEYLSTLCRSEADSLGRIAAAVLLLLELDGSLGQAAIDQLASLGSELAGIFTPEKLSTK
ncbi:hypothetical protein ACQ4PT_056188 [Festuca glaucescens]